MTAPAATLDQRWKLLTVLTGAYGLGAFGMLGASPLTPSLVDGSWIYGGDEDSIFKSVYGGRQGHMPRWEGRLTAVDRKILALYIVDRSATK